LNCDVGTYYGTKFGVYPEFPVPHRKHAQTYPEFPEFHICWDFYA
jgi:hypothetical protein